LITPAIVSFALGNHKLESALISLFAVLVIVYALVRSRRASTAIA
jgi:hypothetical protein